MNKSLLLGILLVSSLAFSAAPQPKTADWSGVVVYAVDNASVQKPKPKPIVPEPSVYGAALAASALLLVGYRRLKSYG